MNMIGSSGLTFSIGGGIPDPYRFVVGSDGKLNVYKNDILIGSQDEYGEWVRNQLTTGIGSIHLGELHSNGSAGENVVWVNENSSIAYYPPWSGATLDGVTSYPASARELGSLSSSEVYGPVGTATVAYQDITSVASNTVVFRIGFYPKEAYTGKLRLLVELTPGDIEVVSFYFDTTTSVNVYKEIQLNYPLFAKAGQQYRVSLMKADGNPLLVTAALSDNAKPYRKFWARSFTDSEVITKGHPEDIARLLETLSGANRLDASAIKNLDVGGFVGIINFAGGLSQFANATKGSYWKATQAGSLGGATFAIGDQLTCKNNVTGTPPNLTDATYWAINPNTNAIATSSTVGMVKVGNGLSVAVDGNVTVKPGLGIYLDGSGQTAVDAANLDVTTLKNASSLVNGIYKGQINGSSTLSTLTDAVRGNWWICTAAVTISGQSFAVGDQLWCFANVSGVPADLSNFNKVPNTTSNATTTTAGIAMIGTTLPLDVRNTTDAGTSTAWARSDHQHALGTTTNISSPSGSSLIVNAASAPGYLRTGNTTRVEWSDTAFYPSSGQTIDIGKTGQVFANVYANRVKSAASTALEIDGTSGGFLSNAGTKYLSWNGSAFSPQTTSAYDLGTSSLKFRSIYLDTKAAGTADDTAASTSFVNTATAYTKAGMDFTNATRPSRIFRDIVWMSSAGGSAITPSNVQFIAKDIDDAEKLAVYMLQQLVTFLKNLENDNQYDQMIGAWPANASLSSKLASGSFPATPSSGTDMDNTVTIAASANYATEWFELVVASSPDGATVWTTWVNIALFGSSLDAQVTYPFRMVYQTARGDNLTSFPTTSISSIAGTAPKCTARTSYTAPAAAFLLWPEVVSIELRR